MWFYPLLMVLVILCIAGGVLLGGVFTIVLVPIGAIAIISAVVYAMWGRALQGSHGQSTGATAVSHRPLPAQPGPSSAPAPTTPDQLADARRQTQ